MDHLCLFNNTLIEFLSDLGSILPNDPCVQLYSACLSGVMLMDDTKIIRGFKKHVSDVYGSYILRKDSCFFLNHTYENLASKKSPDIAQLIHSIKTYWQTMSPSNQQVVWKYMRVLYKLCEKWHNTVDEDLKITNYIVR